MIYKFSFYGFLKNLRFFEPFIILLFREEGLSFFQIGLLYSIRDLTTNIIEIPSGIYADAFGRRKSMLLSFSAYIISFLVFYLFTGFYFFAGAMIFFAVGEAFRTGTHKALILEYLNIKGLKNQKVSYYGRTRAASQFGSAINSLIAAALVFYSGNYRYVFLATALPYVLNLINLTTYPKELDGDLIQLKKGAISEQLKTTFKAFFAIFKDRDAMRAILNSASFTAFFKSTKDYLQPVIKTLAISIPLFLSWSDTRRTAVIIGIVYFIIYMLTSYASHSAEKVSKRFANIAKAINVTFWIGASFLFIAGLASWKSFGFLSVLVFLGLYIIHNLRKPMNVAFISDQISNKVMASGLSVESQVTTILMVIISPLLGVLADIFSVGVALACLGGIMFVFFAFVKVNEKLIIK